MLTARGKYGLKTMVHLARLGRDESALAAEIADSNSISKKFLEAILAQLKAAGLVSARKGRGGGYRLARPARDITVGEIVRVLDGPLAPIACASVTAYQRCRDCKSESECAVRKVMVDARNAIARVLDKRSLAAMRDATSADGRTRRKTS
jgi:Rrf2 family protein